MRIKVWGLSIAMVFILVDTASAQVKIGNNATSINSASLLELESSGKVFVLPRMTTGQMMEIVPLDGAMVFNLTEQSIFQHSDGMWKNLAKSAEVGDVKNGFQAADHGGWYLMDGRNISTLPSAAQSAASSLGLGTKLPNASDSFLKSKNGGSSILGSNGGSSENTLMKTHLPEDTIVVSSTVDGDHTHSGTTSYDGNHDHSYRRSVVYFNYEPGPAVGYGSDEVWEDTSTSGGHTHTLSVNNSGSHSHEVSIPLGDGAPINNEPPFLVVNSFIYLGE